MVSWMNLNYWTNNDKDIGNKNPLKERTIFPGGIGYCYYH